MVTKARQLKRFKYFATGLLVLMLLIYLSTYLVFENLRGIGFVRAFSEAGMVGALADWFAVTALFRHPLGLPIPHTNLIERSKSRIGKNLGAFISSNFLNAATIRPRVSQLKVASRLGDWLIKAQNRQRITEEVLQLLKEGIEQLDEAEMQQLIQQKGKELIEQIPLNKIAGSALEALVKQEAHQEWARLLAQSLATYLSENKEWVKEKVKQESHFLVPGFVDNIIASKILKSAIAYLEDFSNSAEHPQRTQLTKKLLEFARRIKTEEKWQENLSTLKDYLLSKEQLPRYSERLWQGIKKYIQKELTAPGHFLENYLNKSLEELGSSLSVSRERQEKLNKFFQAQVFRLILRNKDHVADLISQTVGKWRGRELSDKLELEVGKDLQFIRINGTLVGGLIGILIHALTLLLKTG